MTYLDSHDFRHDWTRLIKKKKKNTQTQFESIEIEEKTQIMQKRYTHTETPMVVGSVQDRSNYLNRFK